MLNVFPSYICVICKHCTQSSLNHCFCFVFGLQVGKPTAVIRQPYEGKVISVWTTDWEHERPYESPAVCLQLPKPNQLNAVCLSTWNCLNTFLLVTHTLFSHLHQIKKCWCWSLGQLRSTLMSMFCWQIVPLLYLINCGRFPGQLCSAHRSVEPTVLLKMICALTYIIQSGDSLYGMKMGLMHDFMVKNVMWNKKNKQSLITFIFTHIIVLIVPDSSHAGLFFFNCQPLLSWMFVAIGNRSDVFHPKASFPLKKCSLKMHWRVTVLRFILLTQIDVAFAYSTGLHIIIKHTIYAHVWTEFILFHDKKKKGLWLSPSIMWQLPIGLACWRGIMPQGQLRHNVSLSGCHTGQWRRVSHRRPTHPWAVPLPSSFLWQWKAWCEAGGAGLYSGDWVSILCRQKNWSL